MYVRMYKHYKHVRLHMCAFYCVVNYFPFLQLQDFTAFLKNLFNEISTQKSFISGLSNSMIV